MGARMGVAALVAGAALGLGGCGSDESDDGPLSSPETYRYGYAPGFEPDAPVVHTAHVLMNEGDETVSVLGIEPFPDTSILIGAVNDPSTTPSSPFEPFALAPEEFRLIGIASALRICERSPSTTRVHSRLLVRFRVSVDEREVYLDDVAAPPVGEEHDEPCIDPGEEER